MIKQLLSISLLLLVNQITAQTFNGGGGPILDQQTVDFPLTPSGLPTSTNTTTFGLERICINLTHTYDGDLTVSIVSPDGNVAILIANSGGGGDDMLNTCFQWDAPNSITTGTPPFSGSFKPLDEFGFLNNGQNPNGLWNLRINDNANNDVGDLVNWSITFSNNPATFFQFTESDLPIIVINTNGQSIPDEPKIQADMGIIYNGVGVMNYVTDPYNNYNNKIGIEQRGSSSASFPQKSYGFKTRDVNGTDHDTILLGMPSEKDWILYAPYNDKSCMRNIITYDIANKTGHYAPRTKLCELVIDGQYKGIYVLMEKIKRDNNRVDIANLQPIDIAGDELTGGYIIKVDRDDGAGTYWNSNFLSSAGTQIKLVHVEPKGDAIMPEQRTYIQNYIDSFETALDGANFADPLIGYRNYIDVPSFVDFLLLNEASRNIDAYRLSSFLYKDKTSNGGKLVAGPAWDYNLAWWNADYCQGESYTDWVYNFNDICGGGFDVPFWWAKLMEDPAFQSDVKCRWTELRQTTLSIPTLNLVIDSIANSINLAQDRHFYKWPILGIYTWPNPSPIPADFPGEILAMKDWIQQRFAWMDANISGICYLGLDELAFSEEQLNVWPNPFNSDVNLQFYLPTDQQLTISVTDILGKTVKVVEQTNYIAGDNNLTISLPTELVDGVYFLNVHSAKGSIIKKVLKSGN